MQISFGVTNEYFVGFLFVDRVCVWGYFCCVRLAMCCVIGGSR